MTLNKKPMGFYALLAGLSLAANIACYNPQASHPRVRQQERSRLENMVEDNNRKLIIFDEDTYKRIFLFSPALQFKYGKKFDSSDIVKFYLAED